MSSTSTPFPSPSFLFFVICFFLPSQFILQSAAEPYSSHCRPFKCGQSLVQYPFSIEINPQCGLGIINCLHDLLPLLQVGDTVLVVEHIDYKKNTLVVHRLYNFSSESKRGCFSELQNFTIPTNAAISYEVKSPTVVVLVCKHDSLTEPQRKFLGAARNISGVCRDHGIFFLNADNFNQNFQVPHEHGFHNECRVVRLPVREPLMRLDWNRSDEDLYSQMDAGFLLEWNLPSAAGEKINWKRKLIIGVATGAIALVLIIALLVVFKFIKWRIFQRKGKQVMEQNVQQFIQNYRSSLPRKYSYNDIKKMTNGFKEKLGVGGYGNVFKGKLPDGRLFAAKMLHKSDINGQDFINEVATIGRIHHVNIIRLLGFFWEGSKQLLIYEFMPNGSLGDLIREEAVSHSLGWERLLEIALGVAYGIEYLHHGCESRIDIKPHNVLLDESFNPKISDFGLAKIYSRNHSFVPLTGARGTAGYIAPEVFLRGFGNASNKSDVYSYGMLLLEMVGAKKEVVPGDQNSSKVYFPEWIYDKLNDQEDMELIDDIIGEDTHIAKKMVMVGLWCIQIIPKDRPSMTRVVDMLCGSVEAIEMPPKSSLFSPLRVQNEHYTSPTCSGTLPESSLQ